MSLSLSMKECLYGPDETIYNEKEDGDKLYFLINGEILLFVENSKNYEITNINFYEVIFIILFFYNFMIK